MFLRRKREKPSFLKRLLRSSIAVMILAALVLGVSLFVKALATLDADGLATLTSPIATKLGLDEDTVGEVAGDFARRLSQTSVSRKTSLESPTLLPITTSDAYEEPLLRPKTSVSSISTTSASTQVPVFSVALVADNHDNLDNLGQALLVAQDRNVSYILHLGDHTNWGDVVSLTKSKSVLDSTDIDWFSLPGDHDLAQSIGTDNFVKVFGAPNRVLDIGEYTFILFDNSANFTPVSPTDLAWFERNVKKADFVLLSQPLYHPTFDLVMGIVDGEEVKDVKAQSNVLLSLIRSSNVKAVVAADHHLSSKNHDPIRQSLKHVVIGALATSRNLQTPRFSILDVFEDGTYSFEEITLKK